jgi:succinyl-CoA synthetase beta subunit
MNLHEHQTKQLFAAVGIAVPRGRVARSGDEAAEAFRAIGVPRAAVKAQVHSGGRGKAGGIKVVGSADEAHAVASGLLGTTLKTFQAPDGKPIHSVLVEEAVRAAREFYVGITLDRRIQKPVLMASAEGGMDIEEIARTKPESILKEPFGAYEGLMPFQARKLAWGLGLSEPHFAAAVEGFLALARLYLDKDATLLEINPLATTEDGRFLALDGKFNVDERALGRHPDLEAMRDPAQEDPAEFEANQAGLSYVSMPGEIGCMVNGAGLAMATMDIIHHEGKRLGHGDMWPANFLDVGGGANKDQIARAFKLLVANPRVKAVLINIFGGILKCDILAQGIVEAAREIRLELPLVVRLEGTNVEQGREILRNSGLKITPAAEMSDAARKAILASQGRA